MESKHMQIWHTLPEMNGGLSLMGMARPIVKYKGAKDKKKRGGGDVGERERARERGGRGGRAWWRQKEKKKRKKEREREKESGRTSKLMS